MRHRSTVSVIIQINQLQSLSTCPNIDDIINTYLPLGFSNFKIEGRGLGSAVNLEFLLYYLIRPEYQLTVREEVYLDSMLDLF